MAAPVRGIAALDVPLAQVEANTAQSAAREALERHVATLPVPKFSECVHCGDRRGAWVPDPSGARWPNGAQVLVCADRCTAADPDRHALDLDADTRFAQLAANYTAGSPS
ncbi:hypothetical protein [Streptomyces sp. 4R-3d]|uniref:hypothetical protein n=1 Tax=Streptomyces sp. 4R-3d TaxID=2559605 RepID=UPI00107242F3|nr:hypothetical protein [Streptomyces sp. 4R-3d]TFI30089.1 hypothetical protein E4P36_04895 [Streptomyces sp. 4R-3d]